MKLNPIQFCYASAMMDGLRLVNATEDERHIKIDEIDTDALRQYVRVVGNRYVNEFRPVDMGMPRVLPDFKPNPTEPLKPYPRHPQKIRGKFWDGVARSAAA